MGEVSSDLLFDLYGCVDQPERWTRTLDSICSRLNVRSAALQIFNCEQMRLREQWSARDTFSTRHAAIHDIHVNNADNPRLDLSVSPLPQNDYLWPHIDEQSSARSDFRDLKTRLDTIGLGHSICIGFQFDADRYLSLILHKAAGDGTPYSSSDVDFLRRLGPHVEQMTRVTSFAQKALSSRTVGESVLDHMRVGVVVCDEGRHIEWVNRAGRSILDRSEHLTDLGGSLRCLSHSEDKRLASLVETALQARENDGTDMLVVGRDSLSPAQISVATVEPAATPVHTSQTRRSVVLFLSVQEDGHNFEPQETAALYALSPAEGALAAALSNGLTLQEYADDRGISTGTARVQLKQVLAKTGTNRQAELVRRVNSSLLGFRYEGPAGRA
ncbi:helix-turn-helix transcriptional regulator [Croceicoccus sediminis]|uniref:helix-turn-helix transcriptional regulator n=1 Tax=Croceicoccus sediminis TaxID=2571150 RepID=UPI001183F342|nr:helix-turn-helix transcriptional regulator [Croceicoccus sediminis]